MKAIRFIAASNDPVPKPILKTEGTSLENFRHEILTAIDMLILGI
jgi:hypothetical protein